MGFEQADFSPSTPKDPEVIRDTKTDLARLEDATARDEKEGLSATSIEVGIGDFKALVDYIEKKGFVVTERGVACDHQYTFVDSRGNRHALMTIKRDVNGKPSMTGTVTQISVWAYYKGIKDQAHYFGYRIDSDKVTPFADQYEGEWKQRADVKFGYEEFLKKVKGK